MYINIDPKELYHVLGGGQLINISTVSKDGIFDVMTCAWNTMFDTDQPLTVLAREHTTTKNILDTGRYVIALPTKNDIALIKKVGSEHGAVTGDKFKWAGINPEFSQKMHIPVIPRALAYIECEMLMRDMFEKTGILVGQAQSVLVDELCYDQELRAFVPGVEHILHNVDEDRFYCEGKYFN